MPDGTAPVYLDDQGNPSGGTPPPQGATPTYLDEQGNPIGATQQPGAISRLWQGAVGEVTGAAKSLWGAVSPPSSASEEVAHAVGGPGGLVAYRAAKKVTDSVEGVFKGKAEAYQNLKQDALQSMAELHKGEWRNGLTDALSASADTQGLFGSADASARARELIQGTKPGGDLATPLGKTVADAGMVAVGEAAGGKLGGGGEAADAEAAADTNAATHVFDPATKKISPIQQVLKGEKVAQGPAQSALRGAAGAGETGGVRTLLDEPIAAVAKTERATYDTLNKASGTDLKALYDHAEEVQDALDDPTNIAQKSSLQAELKTTQDQIATGEATATKNGVDPSVLEKAKGLTQERYAKEALKQKLFNNEGVVKGNVAHGVDETINVDAAIRNVENLDKPSRFAPEGAPTRLQQALGPDGAAKLKQGLYDAQKAGQVALKRQALAKIVGRAGLGVLGAGAGTEIVRHILH